MRTENNLEQIIAEAKKGNRQAQNTILESLWDVVFAYVLKRIKHESDAEDITITTFTKALTKLKLYNQDFDFKTWVISIAHNTLIDHVRKRPETNISMDNDELFLEIAQSSPTPEEEIILQQDNEKLLNHINLLSNKYRNILILRYQEHKTLKEIAAETNLSLANVKVRIMRAKKLLNQSLNES